MAYAPLDTYFIDGDGSIIGFFIETENGYPFEFSANPELTLAPLAHGGKNVDFPHLVWVCDPVPGIDCGYRKALVKKTVAHVITDERDDGSLRVEKWNIKDHRIYIKITA